VKSLKLTFRRTPKNALKRDISLIQITTPTHLSSKVQSMQHSTGQGGFIVSKQKFELDRLSAEEIIDIINSEDVNEEQLDLLAAHTQHMNYQLKQQVEEMTTICARIEQRLNELKGGGAV